MSQCNKNPPKKPPLRSSARLAKFKVEVFDMAARSSSSGEHHHRPTAGDSPMNNDCGVLPGE